MGDVMRTIIDLKDEQVEKLAEICERDDISRAEAIRQAVNLYLSTKGTPKPHIRDLMQVDLTGNPIAVADHCYGCTAGQGSSCGGALA